ncbi:RING_finger and CHY zinc finger domain-containing protein [Hexamita inflata]|uniref:RING finger and CHY zinc finger domain-containing protein n=1 Tax=Hexamita inflata TaxID=28002 RepID=A0AA86PQA4_9EUKA|nr:RING finger and CHY zinc finger domain-containing protein [Hexamita inflata]CAI9942878.1 RING finger and CHY zinc finger domain-containing protein [Hexamita inflata]
MCICSFNISLTKCDCLMQPIAQQQADHSQEHCNEVMIAKIFKLEPGSRDKSDSDKQIVLRQFTYQTISDERKSYIDSEMKKIYHHMLLEYYDPTIPDYTCLSNFHKREGEYAKNWVEKPLDQQVFAKYELGKSVGCGHYIRGCQVRCETCQKFYPCRLCHDDEEDHDFPRYKTTTVKCNYCHEEQPIQQNCRHCNALFGSYYCDKCKLACNMGVDAKPNYHCDGCKMCMVGLRSESKHCDKCNGCFNVAYFDKHKCIQEKSDCIICLGELTKTIYGRIVLQCGHQLHSHCYHQLINSNILKCPICKRFMPVDQDRDSILRWQKKLYRKVFIPFEYEGYVVKVKCNDCSREFPQHHHPLLYYCPSCDLFNCEIIDEYSGIPQQKVMQILKQFENQNLNIIHPRHTQVDDVLQVLQDQFGDAQVTLDYLGCELDKTNVAVFGAVLNQFPKTLEELKALYISSL